jgi:hypothetical protein
MFVQVMHVKVKDAESWNQMFNSWDRDVRPGAIGFVGATIGMTDNGEVVAVARFESAELARQNSERPAQSAWYESASAAFVGEPTFHDCTEVDTVLDGGSDAATYVQVMEGRAKDKVEMRTTMPSLEGELRRVRPDLLGGTIAWHGDGASFTQVAYFTSEAEARKNEVRMADEPSFQRFSELIDGEMTYYDLRSPRFE